MGEVGITIEDNVVLSANAMILDSGLDIRDFLTVEKPKHIHRKIIIKSGAWIGAGAIILPGVIVGEKSVVAAGSVVTRDVPPYCLVGGNPAKTIRVLSK